MAGMRTVGYLRRQGQGKRVLLPTHALRIGDEFHEPIAIPAFGDPIQVRPHAISLADRVTGRAHAREQGFARPSRDIQIDDLRVGRAA